MQQSHALIDLLKKRIRESGKTYKDIAKAIGLSEASIKRLFSEKTFTLTRIEEVCNALEIDLIEALSLLEKKIASTEQLTLEQERELVADHELLLVAVLVLGNWSFAEILQAYTFSEHQLIQHMAKLDKMKFIELLPGNRVRLLVARNFDWLAHGPIQKFFEKHVQTDFMNSRFSGQNELRLFMNAMLSEKSQQELTQKLRRIALEFNQLAESDKALPLDDKWGTGLVMAMRPWRLAIFEGIRRSPSKNA